MREVAFASPHPDSVGNLETKPCFPRMSGEAFCVWITWCGRPDLNRQQMSSVVCVGGSLDAGNMI